MFESISDDLNTRLFCVGAVAVDGKTLRGSFDAFSDRKASRMMSALRQADQIVLGHPRVEKKSDESPALHNLEN
jgi:hypothetical protein